MNKRQQLIQEVMGELPAEARAALEARNITFITPARNTAGAYIKSSGEVIYLSYLLEKEAGADVLIKTTILHELGHLWMRHDGVSPETEKEAWDVVRSWGFAGLVNEYQRFVDAKGKANFEVD
jgi:predicted SprT family Zn-dependent metalloprotease